MTNDLKISRDLAERLTRPLANPEDFNVRIAARVEMRALLANHSEEPLGVVEPTLAEHCKQCAEVVKTWPESKRDCLGKIAAPVVERQEPVAWRIFDGEGDSYITEDEDHASEFLRVNGEKYASWVTPLYTSPPAPVAVPVEVHKQLIEMRRQFERANFVSLGKLLTACLDKVKELNQ